MEEGKYDWDELYGKLCEKPKGEKAPGTNWDRLLTDGDKQRLTDFILYLFEGLKQFDDNEYINHILFFAVRDITRIIGECINPHISPAARKNLGLQKGQDTMRVIVRERKKSARNTIAEHKIPANMFYEQLRCFIREGKDFSETDARKWLDDAVIAVITKDEEKGLGKNKWGKNRPSDAYNKLGITIERVEPCSEKAKEEAVNSVLA